MWPIGICSWSVNDNVSKLAKIKQKLGIEHLHLNLAPILLTFEKVKERACISR